MRECDIGDDGWPQVEIPDTPEQAVALEREAAARFHQGSVDHWMKCRDVLEWQAGRLLGAECVPADAHFRWLSYAKTVTDIILLHCSEGHAFDLLRDDQQELVRELRAEFDGGHHEPEEGEQI